MADIQPSGGDVFEVPYGHVLAAAGRGLREALYLVTPARAAGGQQNSYSLRKYRTIWVAA